MNIEWSMRNLPESAWFKSSYSSGSGGECIEVAIWSKSSYSGAEGGECVEIAAQPDTIHIRDSKNKTGSILSLTPETWAVFLPFAAQS